MSVRGQVTLTIFFGPTRSRDFARILAYADRWADSVGMVAEGRYAAAFVLSAGSDPARFARAHQLVAYTRSWRTTEIEVDGEPELAWAVIAMTVCAFGWLKNEGGCGHRFNGWVPPRCRPCPLFDPERAAGEVAAWSEFMGGVENVTGRQSPLSVQEGPVPDYVPDAWTIEYRDEHGPHQAQ